MKTGRNDICHCGSGKKYKKCCLAGDDARAAAPSLQHPGELQRPRDMVRVLDQMNALVPHAKTHEMRHLLDKVQSLRAFAECQEKIESARQTLEVHRGEFERLMDDELAYLERARAVFSEERFSCAWFSKEDVGRALKHARYSDSSMDDQRATESLRVAILHLADKDVRARLSVILLNCLPEYVAAGRMIEGWIIQYCAFLLLDNPDDSNVFLFEMFSRGYDAWAEDKRVRENEYLKEFGMDTERLTSMSMDEIDAWVAQQTTPEAQAKLEALFKAHPEKESIGVANLQKMNRDSVTILEREDARTLMLSLEEMTPWLRELQECFQGVVQMLPDGAATRPDAGATQVVADAIMPVICEMAGDIFTEERLQQLAAQLKDYRNERFEAGDKRVAGLAQSAMMLVRGEHEPANNLFLIHLCFHSICTASAAAQ